MAASSAYNFAMVATPTPVEEVVRAMATLPLEAQRAVLDFALFVQARSAAEGAAWDETFATRADDVADWVDRITAADGEPTGIDVRGEVLKPLVAGGQPAPLS